MKRVRERAARRLQRAHRKFVLQKQKLSTELQQCVQRLDLERDETYAAKLNALLPSAPVNSAFLGAFKVFWPAGWGFRASRMTSTVAFMALGSPSSHALFNKSWCSWVSMSIVGSTNL